MVNTLKTSDNFIEKSHKALSFLALAANKEIYNSKNSKALDYAKIKRGLTDDIIKDFKIGFIPLSIKENPQELFSYKTIKSAMPELDNMTIENILYKNGIAKIITTKDNRVLHKEVFGNRLLLPFMDKNDNIIGYTSRRIDAYENNPEFESPKYVNSPESDVFHKREMFFNYNNAKKLTKNTDFCVVCEGTLDAIAYYKANKIPAVAGSGIALSEYQVSMIKDLGIKNVILSYDNDSAGMDAMLRNYPLFAKAGLNVKFINYKNCPLKDMDEIVNTKNFGPETIKKLISEPDNEIDFLLKYFLFQKTHNETKNEQNDSKKITYKNESELADIDKYKILFDTYTTFASYNETTPKSLLLPKEKYQLLQNSLIKKLNISIKASRDLIFSFYNLAHQTSKRKIKLIKSSLENQIAPSWDAFENSETIHDVLDIIGAEKSNKNGFYKSLWNNDSNPSLSVKRNQNLWKDFSSGYGGGIYQLVGYLDLSDPSNPKITDNPKQTRKIDAYNWLIKVLNSSLQQTNSVDNISKYAFTPDQKEKIQTIQSIFKNTPILACDKDKNDSWDSKQKLMKYYPDCFDKIYESKLPPFFYPIKHCNCSYPIYDVSLCDLSDDKQTIKINKNSKYFPFFETSKTTNQLDIKFEMPTQEFLQDPKTNENSTFIIPKEIPPKSLNDICKNNFKIINIINPDKDFIVNNFNILSDIKKPVFVNGQDLYSYVTDKKLIYYNVIASTLAKNSPANIFTDEILNKMNSKSHTSEHYKKIYEKERNKKENSYPPK